MIVPNQRAVSPWRVVALQAVAIFLGMTVLLMIGPLLVKLAREFDTSVAITGQLAAVTYVAWGLSALLVVPFSDIYGRRPILLVGVTLLTVGVVASGFAWSYTTLLLARFLSGMGGALMTPVGMATIADHFPAAQRGRAVGIAMGAALLGSVAGVPLVALVTDVFGWRWAFYTVGAALAVSWVPFWVWFPRDGARKRGSAASVLVHYKRLVKSRQALYIVVGNVFQRMAFFGAFTYLAAYLIETYHKTEGQIVLPLAVAGLGMSLGSFWGGELAVRYRRLTLVALLMLVGGGAGAALYATTLGPWPAVVLALALAGFLYGTMPVLIALNNDVAGESRGTAMGLFAFSNQMGGVLGASLGGLVLALGGFSAMGFLWLGACLVSALVVTALVRESSLFRQSFATKSAVVKSAPPGEVRK